MNKFKSKNRIIKESLINPFNPVNPAKNRSIK